MAPEINLEHTWDPGLKRHYTNGKQTVWHCHHYATLYTKLALETKDEGGVDLFVQTGAEVWGDFLKDYFQKEGVSAVEDRIELARQYWKTIGMGLLSIESSAPESGTASMEYSHIDEGWIKKWQGSNQPVNLYTQGFLSGAFSTIYDKPIGAYAVTETASLAKGDDACRFEILLK